MNEYDITQNIQKLFDEGGLQDILLGVEEYLDNMDLFVFKNWIDGEIVIGPIVSKYWVELTLKYDQDSVPDPRGALLFQNQGTTIQVKKDIEMVTREVREPGDIDDEGKPVLEEKPVILVKFTIPRRLVDPTSVEEYVILDSEEDAAGIPEELPAYDSDEEQM